MKADGRPGYWNIWWTLSALFMALGIAAVVEYLGVFHELGELIGIVSVAIGVWFGITGASRTTVQQLRYAITPSLGVVEERIAVLPAIAETLRRIEGLLEARLPRSP